MNPWSFNILVALGLIGLNACFVLAEYSLVKVRTSRLEMIARKGNARAVAVQGMLREIEIYLSAVQMGITMCSLGLGWIGEPAVAALVENYLRQVPVTYVAMVAHTLSFILAFGIITFLHILLGELVPRSIGLQKADVLALWVAFPLRMFTLIFKTPVTILTNASIGILKLFRMPRPSQAETKISEEEMRVILGSPEERADIPLERVMLLENIFDFGASRVVDAMIPADKVIFLSLSKNWKENKEAIRAKRFSRYPLCRNGLDSAVGYVHIKDIMLAANQETPNLMDMRRNLAEVQSTEPLQKLLQHFADRGIHMALVRNETKKVVGIVTLEDILEELVGEIHDEFDLPQAWSLMDALVPSAVEVGMEVPNMETIFQRLLARLKAAYPDLDIDEAYRTIWTRESSFSSAVGHGVALPHGRLSGLTMPLMAVGRATKFFPIQSPDKLPVRLVFLTLTPANQPTTQLRILSRVATLLSNENLRRRILRARSAENLIEILKTADTVLAS